MKIGIVIATYNRITPLLKCLQSVFKYSKEYNFNIYLVEDHGKTRNEVKEIIESFSIPQIIWVDIAENLGHGGATAIGQLAAYEDDCSYIINLDDDAKIANDLTFKSLIETIRNRNGIGYIGPLGGFLNRFISKHKHKPFLPVSSMGGVLGMTTREVIEKVGFYDSSLRHSADIDFSIRVWLAGYYCAVQPQCKVVHTRNQQGGIPTDERSTGGRNDLEHQKQLENKYCGLVNISKNGSILWWRAFKNLSIGDFLFLADEILVKNNWNEESALNWLCHINSLNMRYG